jgi:hypothetical protein
MCQQLHQLLRLDKLVQLLVKYNKSMSANRNAQVAEQEAEQIEKQLEFDIARFDEQFVSITRSN